MACADSGAGVSTIVSTGRCSGKTRRPPLQLRLEPFGATLVLVALGRHLHELIAALSQTTYSFRGDRLLLGAFLDSRTMGYYTISLLLIGLGYLFNLVNGTGTEVGARLSSHPEVDMVSFTGSTRAGKRVGELAAQSVKRVALELGGKSASLILPDADLEAAVKGSVSACMLNSGQTCSAHTRMLVPESQYEDAKKIAQTAIAKLTLGPSLDESTRLGPLVSAAQRDRVIGFIEQGIQEGAEVVAGGAQKPAFDKGYFVQPTILRVKASDTLAKEEIFGPVLVIITYKDEAEAIRIANDSIYGLGGGVWSKDEAHAVAVARRIRTGQVDINGAPFNSNAPFGGYKQSGNGRENGKFGFEEFLEFKAMQFKPEAA